MLNSFKDLTILKANIPEFAFFIFIKLIQNRFLEIKNLLNMIVIKKLIFKGINKMKFQQKLQCRECGIIILNSSLKVPNRAFEACEWTLKNADK